MSTPTGRELVQAMFESAIANATPLFNLPDMPADKPGATEFNVFKKEAPRLIAEGHKGRFALIKGDRIVSLWDTERDAEQAGRDRFGQENFTVQEVQWYLKPLRWGILAPMQRLTFPLAPDGLRVPAVIGPDAAVLQHLLSQGGALPAISHVRGLFDTGTTVTSLAPSILAAIGAIPGPTASTQTASGLVSVSLYRISFSIYDPTAPTGSALLRDTWTVTNLPQDLPDVDVLFGMDLIQQLVLNIDGPGHTFTVEF